MERRGFLGMIGALAVPVTALAGTKVKDGIDAIKLDKKHHYVIMCDQDKIKMTEATALRNELDMRGISAVVVLTDPGSIKVVELKD